jgi:hypothetical protein
MTESKLGEGTALLNSFYIVITPRPNEIDLEVIVKFIHTLLLH